MDGWQWMGSDDDFPIRQVLPVGLPWGTWARLAWFFAVKKMYMSRYSLFTDNITFYIQLG